MRVYTCVCCNPDNNISSPRLGPRPLRLSALASALSLAIATPHFQELSLSLSLSFSLSLVLSFSPSLLLSCSPALSWLLSLGYSLSATLSLLLSLCYSLSLLLSLSATLPLSYSLPTVPPPGFAGCGKAEREILTYNNSNDSTNL